MNILVVEDNIEVAQFIKDLLEEEPDFSVNLLTEPNVNYSLTQTDLMLLDENLNGASGLDFLKQLKVTHPDWQGPVIMVTGNDDEQLIKKAFGSGIDDYVIKPFKPTVLFGKIRALSTRLGLNGNRTIKVQNIEILPKEHKVWVDGTEIQLTLTEYKILKELAENQGTLVTRDTLKARVYGDLYVTNRTIDVHICSLRKKLLSAQDLLKTVRGVGYRLNQ